MPVTSSNPSFVTVNRTSLRDPSIVQLVRSETRTSLVRAAGAAAVNATNTDVSNRLFSGIVPPLRSRTAPLRNVLTLRLALQLRARSGQASPAWQGVLPVPEPALGRR